MTLHWLQRAGVSQKLHQLRRAEVYLEILEEYLFMEAGHKSFSKTRYVFCGFPWKGISVKIDCSFCEVKQAQGCAGLKWILLC